MVITGIRVGRPPGFGRYVPLCIVLYGGYYVSDDWPNDIPITDDEIRLLASFWLEIASEMDFDA